MKTFIVLLLQLVAACAVFSPKIYGPVSYIEADSYTGGFLDTEYKLRFESNGQVRFSGRLAGLPCQEDWTVDPERFQAIARVLDSDGFFGMDARIGGKAISNHSNTVDLHAVLDEKDKSVKGFRSLETSDDEIKFFKFVSHLETITDATPRINDCFSQERIK